MSAAPDLFDPSARTFSRLCAEFRIARGPPPVARRPAPSTSTPTGQLTFSVPERAKHGRAPRGRFAEEGKWRKVPIRLFCEELGFQGDSPGPLNKGPWPEDVNFTNFPAGELATMRMLAPIANAAWALANCECVWRAAAGERRDANWNVDAGGEVPSWGGGRPWGSGAMPSWGGGARVGPSSTKERRGGARRPAGRDSARRATRRRATAAAGGRRGRDHLVPLPRS